jgi:hypothetical protein
MIKLYREENSPKADAIEAEFKELVLGYDRVIIEPSKAGEMFTGRALPVITNNELVVSGDEIRPYIRELEKLMRDWQMFQGDYCYVDDNGEAC